MNKGELKLLFGTAEPSGEFHASRISKVIKSTIENGNLQIFAIGSKSRLEKQNLKINVPEYFNVGGKALFGFAEYFSSLSDILGWIKVILSIDKFIKENGKPDVFIAITSFFTNYFIAKKLKKYGVRCIYYMPPQIWAWGTWRLKFIKRTFDQILTHFSFESEFYYKDAKETLFCGYPKPPYNLDISQFDIDEYRLHYNIPSNKRLFLCLPGSRKSEIVKLLPIFLTALQSFNKCEDIHIHIINLPEYKDQILNIVNRNKFKDINSEITYHFQNEQDQDSYAKGLKASDFAVCASGTMTFDLMMFHVPMIICYKLRTISYILAKYFMVTNFLKKTKCIGLANIYSIAEGLRATPPIPELFQGNLSAKSLHNKIKELNEKDAIEIQTKWLQFLSSIIPNSRHYDQVAQFIISSHFKGLSNNRIIERQPSKLKEGTMSYLSNIFDLGMYHQKKVKIIFSDENEDQDSGISIISEKPIPLGRSAIYELSSENRDNYYNKLYELQFLWIKKQDDNKFALGGEKCLLD